MHEGVVQIALVKRRTASQTSVNDTRVVQYRTDISNRDGMCIFTGFTGQACHIIPFARGSEVSYFTSYPMENMPIPQIRT